jgi:acyl-CoA thioesterase I
LGERIRTRRLARAAAAVRTVSLSLRGLLVVAAMLTVVASWPLSASAAQPIKIVALGDSLTAGWGLSPEEAFPARLQRALAARGLAVEIANAGVSGDTSAGGLSRMDWVVPAGTEAVILELGGNDGIFAYDPGTVKSTLDQIIRRLKARNIVVLFCGIKAPRQHGIDYYRAFDGLFPQLAANHGLLFYPFFLDGVVFHPSRAQPDGIHPTTSGVDYIVARILPKAEELVAQVNQRRQIAAADREYRTVRQPQLTHIPEIVPEIAKIIAARTIPTPKNIPETASVSESVNIPAVTTPQAADIAEAAKTPETAKIIKTNIPEAAKTSETTNIPRDTNILEAKNIPEAATISETTGGSEAANIPQAEVITEAADIPQFHKIPETEYISETANISEQ